MLQFTCLPKAVSNRLQVLPPMFRHRHHLVFCWLLTAAYWNARLLLWWFADQAIATLSPPDDGVYYLVVESTLKSKTAQKHPLAKKWRLNEYGPYVFGLHLVVVMLPWGNYRIPVDFELVRRKADPNYHSEDVLFRWMLVRFRRPPWAEMIVVVADAAYASRPTCSWSANEGSSS